MNGFALLLATALLGVDYGWQPASDGRLEYIVQLEPVTLIALREGQEVVSQIDPFVRGVRRFRIRVGTDVVPRLGTPQQQGAGASAAAASAPPPGVTYGWQPVDERQLEFLIQIAPERLAILPNEPVTGEMPLELQNVARVRIRAGTGNLPRQNVPQAPAPVAAISQDGGTAPATRVVTPTSAAAGLPGSVPAANSLGGAAGVANATTPGSSWPPDNRASTVKQPSRYDPPANAPTTVPTTAPGVAPTAAPTTAAGAASSSDPRSGFASKEPQDAPWQNAAGQNPTWSAAQQPAAGGFSPPPTSPSIQNAGPQPGLADLGSYPASGSGLAAPGNNAGLQPPANLSPPWGTPDDRYTTDRGQWAGNAAAASPSPPTIPTATGWAPLVSLPPSAVQPPETQSPFMPPSSAWQPPLAGSVSPSEMASPFFDGATATDRASNSLASLTQPPWQTATAVREASFPAPASKKQVPDFWADLAAAANDPSVGFLREEVRLAESDKPWWPLTLAMLALFASMGGNLYIGWIAVDVYRRYLEMAEEEDDDEPYDSRRDRENRRESEDRPRRRERAAVEVD
jgi:hypothetical protein